MKDLKKKGIIAFVWEFTGKIAHQGTGFLLSIFLARLLTPEDYGLLAMVNVLIGLASGFMDMGLRNALVQRKRLLDIHLNSVFYFNISIGSLLTLVLYVSAPWISDFYERPGLLPLVEVMSFSFLISSLSVVQGALLRKQLSFGFFTKIAFITSIVGGIAGLVFALNGFGVWSLVAQYLTKTVLYQFFLWSKRNWFPRLAFSWKALKQLWSFGFRMFVAGLLDTFFSRIDVMVIGKIFSPMILGFYQRAKSLDQMVVTYSSGSLMPVLFPVISTIQNDQVKLKSVVYKSFHLLSWFTFGLLGGLYLYAEDLIVLIFTEKWIASVDYFKILILGGFIYPLSALLVNILRGKGNSKAFLKLEIYKKIFFGINLLVGFWFGMKGYLYGHVIAALIALYLNIYFASKEIKINKKWFYSIFYPYLLISVVLVWIILQLESLWIIENRLLHMLYLGLIFSSLYLVVTWAFQLIAYKILINELSTNPFVIRLKGKYLSKL